MYYEVDSGTYHPTCKTTKMTKTFALQSDKQKNLTFQNAVKWIIYTHFFFGYDIRPEQSYHFICNIFFAIHLIISILVPTLGILKCELINVNTQQLVFCGGSLLIAIIILLIKITYRMSCRHIAGLIRQIDLVLKLFGKKHNVFLNQMQMLSRCLTLMPIFMAGVNYLRLIEYRSTGHHIKISTSRYEQLDQKYNVQFIHLFIFTPTNAACTMIGLMILIAVMKSFGYVIKNVNEFSIRQPKKYLKCHANICKLYELTEKALGKFLTIGLTALVIFLLTNTRSAITSGKGISISFVTASFTMIALLAFPLLVVAHINNELQNSLGFILNKGYQIKAKDKYLMPILELYTTMVSLNDSYVKLNNMRVKSQLFLAVLKYIDYGRQ
ncbi:hypothetical protein CHUAL_009935 [Chamberlinius hualienensis]